MNEHRYSDSLNEHQEDSRIVLDVAQVLHEMGIETERYTEGIIQILSINEAN
ncbi:hypothetical protein [Paenibacillus marinisediminis]